jgi:hypothetical protein
MLQSIVDTAKDRISSPIFGVFFFSWSVCNWEMLLFVTLSELPILERIEYLKTDYINILDTVFWPIATAMVLTFVIPIFQEAADITLRAIKLLFLKKKQELDAKEDINHRANLLMGISTEFSNEVLRMYDAEDIYHQKFDDIFNIATLHSGIMSHDEFHKNNPNSSLSPYIKYLQEAFEGQKAKLDGIQTIISNNIPEKQRISVSDIYKKI